MKIEIEATGDLTPRIIVKIMDVLTEVFPASYIGTIPAKGRYEQFGGQMYIRTMNDTELELNLKIKLLSDDVTQEGSALSSWFEERIKENALPTKK